MNLKNIKIFKKEIFITFATLGFFIILGIPTSLYWPKFIAWEYTYSDFLLLQSQKYDNTSFKFPLAEQSFFLKPNESAAFEIARLADKSNNKNLAEKYLLKIDNPILLETFVETPPTETTQTYNHFINKGYPQIAKNYLILKRRESKVNRDQLLALSSIYFTNNDFRMAHEVLLEATVVDPYYPQTYQQLIKVAEKLENDALKTDYLHKLSLIKL